MALRESRGYGWLYFCEPVEIAVEDITATSIPLTVPTWLPDTWYPAGAMVTLSGRTFLSVLTEAASYRTDCPRLYNVNQVPTDTPPPFVPIDERDDPAPCMYAQAGMAWWAEVSPEHDYLTAMLNPNIYSGAEVQGTLTMTVAPKVKYDAVGVFGLQAATATLSNGDTQDLALYLGPEEASSSLSEPGRACDHMTHRLNLGPRCTHADRVVWLLDAPTTAPFTLTLTPLNGVCKAGTLVVARTNVLGVTNYQSTVGIVDYSRKERDLTGRVQLVPRWFQGKVRFSFTTAFEDSRLAYDLINRRRNYPNLIVGHDDMSRRELQIFGIHQNVTLPLDNSQLALFDLTVESVGVPRLVTGIPMPPIPDPPPLPQAEIPAPWLAIGHDEEPYITIVNSLTWQKVIVHFEIPGPARAVLFNYDSSLLYIGHECPPYFTVVETEGWTEVTLEGSSEAVASSSDRISTWDIGTVTGLAQTADSERSLLALAHQCPPYVTVFDTLTWQVVSASMPELPMSISRVTFSPDSQTMLITDMCRNRRWIDTADFAEWHSIASRGRAAVFMDDDTLLLGNEPIDYYAESEEIHLPARLVVAHPPDYDAGLPNVDLPGEPYIIKFTRDGRYIAVGHRCPPYVTIVDTQTWNKVTETFFDIEYSVCSLDFTDDGEFLAAVYKHHPYCTIIRTVNWTEFYLSYEDWEFASSNA